MTCANRKEADKLRLFRWRARSSGGKKYNGEYYAESEEQVIDFVHSNYGYVQTLKGLRIKQPFSFGLNRACVFQTGKEQIFTNSFQHCWMQVFPL